MSLHGGIYLGRYGGLNWHVCLRGQSAQFLKLVGLMLGVSIMAITLLPGREHPKIQELNACP